MINYALTATEARSLGLSVKVGMPLEVMEFMKLYPQPIRQSGVEYLPIDAPLSGEFEPTRDDPGRGRLAIA